MPRVRQAARRYYWAVQKKRYSAQAAKVEVDKKLVFFEAYGGRSFSCSPKALYLFMLGDGRFSGYRFVWSFKNGCIPEGFPENDFTHVVARGSREYFEALSCAGCIIQNNRLPEYVFPKRDQVYVQCWHGTPLKRLGFDVEIETSNALNTTNELAYRFGMDAQKWSHLISPSPYASLHLADAFGLEESRRESVLIEEGYPRNDILVKLRDDARSVEAVRQSFGIACGKKVILYAPTWRDDSYQDGVGYTFDYLLDFDHLQRELGDEWVILFRAHYYIANSFDFSQYEGFVLDVSNAPDINDLYLSADVLLTDYSSVMFDYANLRRPIILFVPDVKRYADAIRGFYFDLSEIPGPKCETTKDVVEAIDKLDSYFGAYGEKYAAYVGRFCPLDDGHASDRVIDRVFFG